MRLSVFFVSTIVVGASAFAADTAPPSWQVYADCATAYRANWLDRLDDPNRTHEMRNMIESQSQDYEKAADRAYVAEKKTSEDAAAKDVKAYVQGRIDHFVAMDKARELEPFIDNCPQLEFDEN